ncbi:MAG: AAA family ATPase [Coleofasciculus sp. C1-SOL-03]|uniref:nSTAND1 domain-containing NTPase n=1 Tax=Coleofasciculus sp. C1-SOL-03 TaxID=3069522 RepID=UPI0032FDC4DE
MDNYIDESTIDNQESLEELTWAIEASEGRFYIMLARCNYAYLQDCLIQQVQDQCALNIRVIHLKQSDRTLYSTICAQLGQEKPAALMVSGLATVDNLDDMLRATNQVREEFRKNFHFPVILWINDAVHVKFLRIAPDFESWTTTTRFAIPTDELIEVLQQNVESLFATALAVNSSQSLYKLTDVLAQGRLSRSELDLALKELPHRVQDLDPQLEAGLQFIRGLNGGDSPEALEYFQQSLTFWQQVEAGLTNNLSNQTANLTKPAPINPNVGEIDNQIQATQINAKLKAGLVLFHIGLYHYHTTDRKKHQDVNWQNSKIHLQHCLNLFDQENRPDLVAKCINQLERVLQRMQAWDELEQVAKKALPLHQQYGSTSKLAQDYSFLAEVALQQQRWDDARQAAQQAEDIISQLPKYKRWIQGLNLLFLAQAERQLGNKQAAISHLVKARELGNFGHPLIYVRILEELRDLYFEERQYLAAFATKQQRRSIEQQYGIRAFIGAGRLQPHREDASYWSRDRENLSPNLSPAIEKALSSPSLKNQQEASAKTDNQESVAPEIIASGRQRDLERLLERIGRNDCKLIVIHGRSGVGKSSLVNAGLVPALKQSIIGTQKNVPIAIRVYTNWIEELEKQLVNENEPVGAGLDDNRSGKPPNAQQNPPNSSDLEDNLPEKTTISPPNPPYAKILEQLRNDEQRQRRTVLIFDQFEEFFFVYTNPAERRLFWRFLADCLNILSVKVILSLREDYLHYLLECNRLDSMSVIGHDILGKNVLYELGNFSPTDARAIIEDLTTRSRFYLDPALIDQLVKDLAGTTAEILPIELQVVGAQLQADNIKTLAEYRELGTKEELVKRYLEEVVEDCGAENQQAAELVLYLLTDEKGTRPLKTRAELERDLEGLAADLTTEASNLDLVLMIFVESGLVFLLLENPYERYQLVHDYLAAFIRQQQDPRLKELIAKLQNEIKKRKSTEFRFKKIYNWKRKTERLIVVEMVTFVSIFVTITGWISSENGERSINELASDLRKEIAGRIEQKLDSYLQIPHAFNQLNANETCLNQLELDNLFDCEKTVWHQMQVFPVSATAIGTEDGKYLEVVRQEEGRFQIHESINYTKEIYRANQQGNRIKLLETPAYDDHRTRPWYEEAVEAGEATWSEVFRYEHEDTLAIAASKPLYREDDTLLGVTSTILSLSHIGDFLESLKITQFGQTFILEPKGKGTLVATSMSEDAVLSSNHSKSERNDSITSDNPLIKATADFLVGKFGSFENIKEEYQLDFKLNKKKQFVQVLPFKDHKGLNWLIVVVVPEDEFMARIHANTRTTIRLCVGGALLAMFVGFFSVRWMYKRFGI